MSRNICATFFLQSETGLFRLKLGFGRLMLFGFRIRFSFPQAVSAFWGATIAACVFSTNRVARAARVLSWIPTAIKCCTVSFQSLFGRFSAMFSF